MALLRGFLVKGAEGCSLMVAATGWQRLRDYKMPAEVSCAMCDILIQPSPVYLGLQTLAFLYLHS